MHVNAVKEDLKYQIIPSREQLDAIVRYFQEFANANGRIHFTQKEMFENKIISPYIGSPSFLNGVLAYLQAEGFVGKIETGSRGLRSVWDVSMLLAGPEEVPTREDVGRARPLRDEAVPENIEVTVIRKEETPEETPVGDNSNAEVLSKLYNAIGEMTNYLQTLPNEIGGHLTTISGQLELADTTAITRLQAQKKDLEDEVQRLKTELEEVSGKANYNTTQIYRQRNLIMDEVDRMINAPAWTIKQNKEAIRNAIQERLDSIMEEVGAIQE